MNHSLFFNLFHAPGRGQPGHFGAPSRVGLIVMKITEEGMNFHWKSDIVCLMPHFRFLLSFLFKYLSIYTLCVSVLKNKEKLHIFFTKIG